jgi:hypothetical protein
VIACVTWVSANVAVQPWLGAYGKHLLLSESRKSSAWRLLSKITINEQIHKQSL